MNIVISTPKLKVVEPTISTPKLKVVETYDSEECEVSEDDCVCEDDTCNCQDIQNNRNKKCRSCLQNKDIRNFISFINGTETTCCRECREKNKSDSKRRNILKELRRALPPCEICGDDVTEHKEFDHIDPSTKIGDVSTLPMKQMLEEAPKCRCLCTKCHRKYTIKNLVSKKKEVELAKQFIKEYKLNLGGCQEPCCKDVFDPENLGFYEFDHIDFKTKHKVYQI